MESMKFKSPKQGEIWLVNYTFNFSNHSEFEIESQIKKLRPSVILSNNIQNEFNNRVIVAPLTSKETNIVNSPFEVLIKENKESNLDRDSKALLNFLVSIDKEFRLVKHIGVISEFEMKKVAEGINTVFKNIA